MAFFQYIFFCVATAHTVPGSPHYWGFTSTLDRTPSVQVISPTQRHILDNIQHSQKTDIHSPGGIRTHNPIMQTTANPRLRPRGHWDGLYKFLLLLFLLHTAPEMSFRKTCRPSKATECDMPCGPRLQDGFRIWPATCLKFDALDTEPDVERKVVKVDRLCHLSKSYLGVAFIKLNIPLISSDMCIIW